MNKYKSNVKINKSDFEVLSATLPLIQRRKPEVSSPSVGYSFPHLLLNILLIAEEFFRIIAREKTCKSFVVFNCGN
jgi:hypothetical protein